MVLVRKLKLSILSPTEFQELEKEAVQIESFTKRRQNAIQKLKQRGGIFFESDKTTNLPKSLVKAQEKLLLQREKTPNKGKNTKGAIVREDRITKIEKRITKNENTVNAFEKIFSQFNIIQGAAFNPIGTGTNLLTGLLSRFLPVGMVLSIATLALQLWIDSYGKGGTRDPRKKVLDDVFSRFGNEKDTDILTGKTYFANSRTLSATQETRSNTMNLRDGYQRSRLIRASYGG